MTSRHDEAPGPGRVQPGRKRDPSLDATLLDATLDVLAEVGASGLTMDAVAARAGAGKATLYRRWTSKSELILDAVAHMKRGQVDLAHLPDTGSLRGDLLGLFKPQSMEDSARKLRIMSALAALLSQDPALAEAVNHAVVEPWAEAHLVLMRRALARGEISASADLDTLSRVIPSMAAYRGLIQHKPFDLAFLVSMVDGVLLPASVHPASRGDDTPPPRRAAGVKARSRPGTPTKRKS